MDFSESDRDRFWNKVDKESEEDCWEWTASKRVGYGAFKLNNRTYSSHRISFYLTNGEIPEGDMILHKCDNRSCVNPKHLYSGNRSDNTNDVIERSSWHPSQNADKGESAQNSKLSKEDVIEIRERYDSGETQVELAKEFPVGQQHISDIVREKIWKHI